MSGGLVGLTQYNFPSGEADPTSFARPWATLVARSLDPLGNP